MPERNIVTGKRKRCLFCLPTLICHQSLIIIAVILLLSTQTLGASRHYYMDNKLDCSMQGFIDIPSRESITVSLKSNPPKEFLEQCTLKFRAENNREFIKLEFARFFIDKCSVKVSTNDNSYSCGQIPPSKISLDHRQFTISLQKDSGDHEYNGDIIVTTYAKDYSVTNQDEVSNPTLIGIIIGVVCGIIVIILVIAIVGHCYYKSVKKRHPRNGCLDDNDQSSIGIGYMNEGVKNGSIIKNNNSPKNNDRSLLSPDVEVKQFYDCIEENKKHTIPNSSANNAKKSVDIDNNSDKTRQQNSNPTPKSPVLSALHNSPKFQASFKSTDAEAEERSKRFSQGSTLPPTPPPLPPVPTSPHMQCSQTNTNHAGIRRVPKISASSEDMEHLEKEINVIENRGNNNILPTNSNPPLSSTKNVSVTTNLQPQLSVEQPSFAQTSSKDNSNQHTLRPARVQDKKKHGDITDGQPMPSRPQKTYKEKDVSINSLRKHGHKIPKSTKGRPLLSDGETNFTSGDDQRSDTPLSELSSRMTRTDDNESLPPLQRTTSRQSLFASRTSLYARRGKRERRSSISDSVTTYAHDDIDMYVASEQDPMDRRDARAFKSLVDITKTSKDGSYQDQTKKLTSKKNAYKKSARKSSSSTQTIEQKGTQTEPSQKKASQSKEVTADSNAALSWGKSTSNIKGDVVNPVQPSEISKSQFQPISKTTDMENSALGNQYLNNVPTSSEGEELTKPTKSPWELLCELTDAEMKMKDSSLPSENALYSSEFPSTNVDGQSRPSVDNIPSVYHPSISSQVSDKESYAPAYSPATVPINYPPSVASNLTNKLYPRKSSWEALKELTDAQLSYPLKGASESIV